MENNFTFQPRLRQFLSSKQKISFHLIRIENFNQPVDSCSRQMARKLQVDFEQSW